MAYNSKNYLKKCQMFFDMDIKNIGVADYNKCIFVCDSKNRQLSVLYLFIMIK